MTVSEAFVSTTLVAGVPPLTARCVAPDVSLSASVTEFVYDPAIA